MRVVLPVVSIAAGLLAATVVMSRKVHSSSLNSPAATTSSSASAVAEANPAEPVPNLVQPLATPASRRNVALAIAAGGKANAASSNSSASGPAKTEFSPAQKISELDDLMISNHPEQEKLGVMLATLGNSDKAVHAAALEHIKELDDRDAVPQLQVLADQTENAEDKAALQEVIDYLNLPSLTDRSAAGRTSGPLVPKNSTWRDRRMTHVPQNPALKPAVASGK